MDGCKALPARNYFQLIAVLIVSLFAAACLYLPSLPPRVPRIGDDLDSESLRAAIRQSVVYLKRLAPDRVVGEQPRRFTVKEVLNSLLAFDELLDRRDCPECWAKEFEERFELIPSSTDAASLDVLFTGYYQPMIEGSLVSTTEYRYPLYGKPADLIAAEQVTLRPVPKTERVVGRLDGESFVPYYSRREIDDLGSLRGRGYEIAWVKDPIDLFFLHIQGSGILKLPDGRRVGVGYATQNGRAYRSIGRLLIDNGKIPREEMSMQRLRRYLRDHPEEMSEILAYNESYVFFRFVEGPLGSLEVPVTAGRSIATDLRLFPKGALAFIETQEPMIDDAGRLIGWKPFSRIVLNQDSGGAIRGFQRVDLFFGTGDQAAAAAGYMNSRGRLYFLALKNAPAVK
ncbi:MAG: MltA domain-containing protein [Deltaproteobacteria bacterium]|nr:MltA domain-containing protein [Deltaproteobacteria bacterium]MDZ4344287.1 MltA domain-containing protein [Candidatus Binatia bacterium]